MSEDAYTEFIRFMDSIFYEGYAEQLSKENPAAFTLELNDYLNNYYNGNNDKNEELPSVR